MGFRTLEISTSAEIHVRKSQLEITNQEGIIMIPLEDLATIVCSGANIRMSSMTTLREELLQIKTKDELIANWDRFADLELSDSEVIQHVSKLLDSFWAPEDCHQDALKK